MSQWIQSAHFQLINRREAFCSIKVVIFWMAGLIASLMPETAVAVGLGTSPSPAELLTLYANRVARVSNLKTTTLWIDNTNGRHSARETTTIIQDNIGRYRLEVHGQLLRDGGPPKQTDQWRVYDGELTVTYDGQSDPYDTLDISVEGRAPSAKQQPAQRPEGFVPYRSAFVYSGLLGGQSELETCRHPFSVSMHNLLLALKGAVAGTFQVDVSSQRLNGREVCMVHFTGRGTNWHHEYVLEPTMGFLVSAYDVTSANGLMLERDRCRFRKLSDDLWIADQGHLEVWAESADKTHTVPVRDCVFECTDVRANDPGFSNKEFAIALPADTQVNDVRFHVTYRTGEEPTASTMFEQLAKLAKTEQDQRGVLAVKEPQRWPSRLSTILLVNVTAAVALLAFLLWRRRRISAK